MRARLLHTRVYYWYSCSKACMHMQHAWPVGTYGPSAVARAAPFAVAATTKLHVKDTLDKSTVRVLRLIKTRSTFTRPGPETNNVSWSCDKPFVLHEGSIHTLHVSALLDLSDSNPAPARVCGRACSTAPSVYRCIISVPHTCTAPSVYTRHHISVSQAQ